MTQNSTLACATGVAVCCTPFAHEIATHPDQWRVKTEFAVSNDGAMMTMFENSNHAKA